MPDSAIHAVAELAASQHSVFTRAQAASLDFARHRVATALGQGWLTEPYPGVLAVHGAPVTWRSRLAAAVLAGGAAAVASHRAAARLHGFDGFERTTTIELTVDRRHRWQFGHGVVAHHLTPLDPCDAVVVDGIACTSVARTLADLGSVVRDRLVGRALTGAGPLDEQRDLLVAACGWELLYLGWYATRTPEAVVRAVADVVAARRAEL